MQILNLATLLAVLGASSAFNNRHAEIVRRQNVAGASGTSSSLSSTTTSAAISASASASASTSSSTSRTSTLVSSSSSSNAQVTTSSTTTTTSANVQSTGTVSTQQTTTISVPGAPTGTTTSSTSIVLTGDATLSATGVPALASISSGMPTESTYTLTTTYAAGATPPVKGAPPLPTPFVFNPSIYPPMDKSPDVNSPEVQEWLKELDGYDIPDIPPTDGTCAGSPQAAANAQQNGWWTCGHWTRPTDIVDCPTKMTWGVTFDDGPSPWTPKLLNFLSAHDINATFFAIGSRVVEFPETLVLEYMSGHEIAVHTWSHPAMTSQTNAQIVAELGWTRKAIQDVLGVTPVYWRPPYGDIDDRVRAIALAMGLVAILWTTPPPSVGSLPFDTNDWEVAGGLVSAVSSYETFENILSNATSLNRGFAVLEHDLFEVTVDLAVGYFLPSALSHQPPFTLEPVLKCQGFAETDVYRETTTNKTFPYPNSTQTDISGTGQSDTQGGSGSGSGSSSATLLHPPAFIAGLLAVLLSALW